MNIVHTFERLKPCCLFVPYFDSYMVIHGNLYAGVILVSVHELIKANSKENTKAAIYRRQFTGRRSIPLTKGQLCEKSGHGMSPSW